METAKKSIENSMLKGFVPLDALSSVHLQELVNNALIEEIDAGQYVFKNGERDNQTVYLLEGVVELIDAENKSVGKLSGRSATAKHPLAPTQPRQLSVRAVGKATVVKIDSNRLDVLLAWGESSGYNVEEISANSDGDWLTRLLQSETFSRLSPVNIQQLLSRMRSMPGFAGEIIVEEGSVGEYFYIVKQGRLSVARKGAVQGKDVLLAELSDGACFGEEALVAGTQRNATVTMLTDGILMRLSKQDFDELLRTPLVQSIDYELAKTAVKKGARWLDVRLSDEYGNCSLAGSINLPLSDLRNRLDELDQDTRYIICCDTGRRSASAAFVLSQNGFDATVLDNGLMEVPWEDLLSEPVAEDGQGVTIDENNANQQQTPIPEPLSVAESAAQAAITTDYVTRIEAFEAENNRLTSELESARLELRHQTDLMARAAKASQENASDLDTAREALARAQNEKQNILTEQTRLTTQVRTLENENMQLRSNYKSELGYLRRELEKNGSSIADVDTQIDLERDLAEARQKEEKLSAEFSKLKTGHKQRVMEKDERIAALEAALESERDAVQQQIDELTATAEGQTTQQQAELQAQIDELQNAATEAGQKITRLQTELKQATEEHTASEVVVQQVRQEADQLRAELEVSRGLESMLPDTSEGEFQEAINQLKTELDAEAAQRVRAEQEVARWKAEAEKFEQAMYEARQEKPAAAPGMNLPEHNDDSGMPRFSACTEEPEPGSIKPAAASRLHAEDEYVAGTGFVSKWIVFLAIGAIAGAAILYWLPDFGQNSAISQHKQQQPVPASAPSQQPVTAIVNEKSTTDTVNTQDVLEQENPAVTAKDVQVSESVADAVAAIEALEAETIDAEKNIAAAEPEVPVKPARKMKPGWLFSDTLADGSRGPRMVQMPAGSFTMGSTVTSANFDERPHHEVTLSAFAMGKFEVTFEEYDRFARDTGHHFPSDAGWGRGRRPVINVNWDEAAAYARWLSEQTGHTYRLPTEAEWEYAARAGTVSHFWWGNEPVAEGRANCFDCGSQWDGVKTAAVGSFPANSVGLHEIAGNVMEWVQDCYLPDYQVASTVGAAVNLTPCDVRVVRGGSYSDPLDTLRSAARSRRVPQSRIDNLGFRVVRTN